MNVNDTIWVRFKEYPGNWCKITMGKLITNHWREDIVNGEIHLEEPEECRDPLVRFREYLEAYADQSNTSAGGVLKKFNEIMGTK